MVICAIGHSGRSPKEFIDLLTRDDIRSIVDMRLRPVQELLEELS